MANKSEISLPYNFRDPRISIMQYRQLVMKEGLGRVYTRPILPIISNAAEEVFNLVEHTITAAQQERAQKVVPIDRGLIITDIERAFAYRVFIPNAESRKREALYIGIREIGFTHALTVLVPDHIQRATLLRDYNFADRIRDSGAKSQKDVAHRLGTMVPTTIDNISLASYTDSKTGKTEQYY